MEALMAVAVEFFTSKLQCQSPLLYSISATFEFSMTSVTVIRYGDGAGDTVEENSSVFSLVRMH